MHAESAELCEARGDAPVGFSDFSGFCVRKINTTLAS